MNKKHLSRFNPGVKGQLRPVGGRPGDDPQSPPSGTSTNLQPFIYLHSSSERRNKSLGLSGAKATLMILTSSSVCCRRVSNQSTRRHRSLWLINGEIPNHPSHFTRARVVFLFSWACRASASSLPPADKQPGEPSLYSLPNPSFRSHPARRHIMGSLMSSSTPNNGADGGFSQINKAGVIVSLL